MEESDVLHSSELKSLVIEIGPEYLSYCLDWLMDRGCTVSPQGDVYYKVVFPEGTREEIRRSLAGHWTRRSAIIFPDGKEAQRVEAFPVNNPTTVHITMGFPASIFPE